MEHFRIVENAERDEAVLKPVVDVMAPNDITDFQAACHQLLATGRSKLVVDFRGFRSVPSVIIGAVLDVSDLASGPKVTLLAEGWAADIFRKLLGTFMDVIETREEPEAQTDGQDGADQVDTD